MLFSIPEPLPPDGAEIQTGIACPDCAGTLIVLVRKDFAAFRCRIGHAYSLPEVLASMEATLERRLWNVVAAMEELADFSLSRPGIGWRMSSPTHSAIGAARYASMHNWCAQSLRPNGRCA